VKDSIPSENLLTILIETAKDHPFRLFMVIAAFYFIRKADALGEPRPPVVVAVMQAIVSGVVRIVEILASRDRRTTGSAGEIVRKLWTTKNPFRIVAEQKPDFDTSETWILAN
jgi:hypothetical protein